MTKFDIALVGLTVLAVVLFALGVYEALHPKEQEPRNIRCTFGPGYEFTNWREDFE